MSMSSLSAQLAAIHASGKNSQFVGSTLATSRRHDDAIGRGLSHSTQVGHAVITDQSALRKPSVIYPNAKTAADVPLTILRENAVTSLYQLTKLTGNTSFSDPCYIQTLCGLTSLQFERGLAMPKENEAMDLIIRDLLYLLSSAMAQERPALHHQQQLGDQDSLIITSSTTSCFSSCLHALEYLVRRYDLHNHSLPLIEHWLISLLPHHEHALFLRVLQLVDLASLPTWMFLRPYAATTPATTTSSVTPPPTRSFLARQVAQHTALVQQVAQLAQRVAQIHAKEVWTSTSPSSSHGATSSLSSSPASSWPPLLTRRGVSHILSFCAAILVEALQWQSTKTGTLDEATIRILLPYLLSACGGSSDGDSSSQKTLKKGKKQLLESSSKWSLSVTCPEYRGWGHVLASCIVELGVLSAEVQQVLLNTLMQGALELDRACCGVYHIPQDPRRVEAAADSILVLLSVLARLPHSESDQEDGTETEQTLLPKVGSLTAGQQQAFLVMGFPRLAYNTIKTLSEWDAFVPAVAHLHSKMDMEVSNLVAAIVVVALHRIMDVTVKPKKMKRAASIILELIGEEGLQSLWIDSRTCLASSFASAIVTAFSTLEAEVGADDVGESEVETNNILISTRSILNALRHVHPRGVDDGVAHAVFGTQQGKHRKSRRKRMALLLGVRSAKHLPIKPAEDPRGEDDMDVDYVLSTGNLLPPRVALEHSDATIRLDAVQRAIKEAKEENSCDGSSLDEALLRRFWVDDHLQVALTAGISLWDRLQSKADRSFSETITNMSLLALYRWTTFQGGDSKQQNSLIGLALKLVGFSIGSCSTVELNDYSWSKVQCCVEAVISHLEDSFDANIRTCALEALQLATAGRGGKGKQSNTTAREMFLSDSLAIEGLKRIVQATSLHFQLGDKENLSEIVLRQRYLWIVLQFLLEALNGENTTGLEDLAFDCCLFALREVDLTESGAAKIKILRKCLDKCVDIKSKTDGKAVPSILLSMAASGDDRVYESVCRHAVQIASKNAVDKSHELVPSFAVILEACLRPGTPALAIERLLSIFHAGGTIPEHATVPLLALLAHAEPLVRSSVIKVISSLLANVNEGPARDFWGAAIASKSVVSMDGVSSLPKVLALAIRGTVDKSKAVDFLLKQCAASATSSANDDYQSPSCAWLTLQEAPGGNNATSIVLSAAELAGEQSFPLSTRWQHAGEPIFRTMLGIKDKSDVPPTLVPLMETVVRMLKGVIVDENSAVTEVSSVIISSGPNVRGTRARSYSVGKIEGVTFMKTFPELMGYAIRDCLVTGGNSGEIVLHLVRLVIEETLGRESWGIGIFSKLERSLQQQIASNLLNGVDGEIGDLSAIAFRNLPIKTRDLAYMGGHLHCACDSLSKVSLIADVVQARASALVHSSHCPELTSALFELLIYLSCESSEFREEDGLEFARHSLLLAIREILDLVAKYEDDLSKTWAQKYQLIDHAKSLVFLLSHKRHSNARPLISQRARSTAIAVLAITCSLLTPDSVLTMLVSTMTMLIRDTGSGNLLESVKLAGEFLSVVVPVYCKLAIDANVSLGHLFSEFVTASTIVTHEPTTIELFGCLVRAINSTPGSDNDNIPCGALLAMFLSRESNDDITSGLVGSIISQHFSSIGQLAAVEELVQIVNGCLASLNGRTLKIAKKSPLSVSASEILTLAGWVGESDHMHFTVQPQHVVNALKMSRHILAAVFETLSSGALRKAIRNRSELASKLCLSLWQDLLFLQSFLNCDSEKHMDTLGARKEWEGCTRLTDDTLHLLQGLLPADVVLAAVSALMVDDTTEELQARSLKLVADRVEELNPGSAEASLFLEQVPKFVDFMDRSSGYLVVQSALVATEKMARFLRLGSNDKNGTGKDTSDFILALDRATAILEKQTMSLHEENFQSEDNSHCQLVISAALASATIVKVVSIRCLPMLPKMVTSLLKALSSANSAATSQSTVGRESTSIVSMVQVSVIRALSALCDAVPQFLGPYIKLLLTPSTLLSRYLAGREQNRDLGVKIEVELLLTTLANRIPCRQLVPCIAQSIPLCQDGKEICILIKLAKHTVDQSSQADTTSQKSNLQRSLMLAYEFQSDARDDILNAANELLLAYVMKLSEAQLFSLYSHFREWRGELDKVHPDANADRRYTFWRLSFVLMKELKSLFLPCLSSASMDAIEELDIGARSLCIPALAQIGHSGKKKRRLDGIDHVEAKAEYGAKSLQTLWPLLGCLESALKADARDGGKWVRADDGQRYTSLLEPLGKLLQCKLPPELQNSASPGRSVFNQLVLGADSEGISIVDCLTALAAAAGNEQLWKPLNHLILEACANESRSEVRRAGISCLLRVIRTIGDEYMVLLPECLPVLSELLEDSDEEIVALAQECVAVGEELLGESLQESLR